MLNDGAHRCRMVANGSLIQRPLIRRKIDAGAPVLQPDIEAVLDQYIDNRFLDRGAENVGADSRAMRKEHRPFDRWSGALHMDKVAREAIPSSEGNDRVTPACYVSGMG